MTAKEKQTHLIKNYLKPILKSYDYATSGMHWWKNMGDFFIVIQLQSSQWNTKAEISFCLNIGIALTATLADKEKKKASYYDMVVHLRQEAYLSEDRKKEKSIRGGLGYVIKEETDLSDFTREFKADMETHILKTLDTFTSLKECVSFYNSHDPWGWILLQRIAANGIKY